MSARGGRPFTERAREATAELRGRIDALPFLRRLGDGDLPPHVFRHYLEQDRCYLREYARALALLAARAPRSAEASVWAGSASGAVAAEESLHVDLLGRLPGDAGAAEAGASAREAGVQPSPTTLAYASWLVAGAATAPYAVAAAAVLPCFTVYAEVGAALAGRATSVPDHPYARWVAAYADPTFQAAAGAASAVVDAAVADEPGHEPAALAAVVQATRFEWMFWDAADRVEGWPV